MIKYFRNIVLILILGNLVIPLDISAQQEPVFTRNTFSTQALNPAYTGIWNSSSITFFARQQWIGIKGAPGTQSIFYQSSLDENKVGYGISITNDKIGKEKKFSMFGDYSYQVPVGKESFLRFGLKLGFSVYSNNLNEYTIYDPDQNYDPSFMGEIRHSFLPNFGVGFMIYNENYFIGASIPKIIQNEVKIEDNDYVSNAEIRHLFLHTGYIFDLSNGLKFKPTLTSGIIIGAPLYVSLSANLLVNDKIWIGILYRIKDSFGLSGQWMLNNNLTIGYAVDFSASELSRYQSGTHEVMITYEFNFNKNYLKKIRLF